MPITIINVESRILHGDTDEGGPVKIGGKAYDTTPSAVLTGQRVNAYFDTEGYLRTKTIITSGAASSGTEYTEGQTVSAITASSILVEGVGDIMRPLQVFVPTVGTYLLKTALCDSLGSQIVSFGGGTQYTEGTSVAAIIGTAAMAEGAADVIRPIQVLELTTGVYALKTAIVDAAGNQQTNFGSSTVSVTNTISALVIQGTTPWSVALTGTAAVTQSTSPWVTADNQTLVDNAGFTDGTSKVFGAGFIFDEVAGTALTENDIAASRIDSKRAQILVIEDSVTRGTRAAVKSPNADNLVAGSITGLCVLNANYVLDGVNWDAQRGDSVNGTDIGGNLAHDAAEVAGAKPLGIGFQARTTNPTSVADADRVRAIADDIGRPIFQIGHCRDLQTQTTLDLLSTTTETILLAAGGAGIFYDIASIDVINRSQISCILSLRDATAGAVVYTIPLAPKQPYVKSFPRGAGWKMTTANSVWTVQLDTVASVSINIQAEKNV